ncbi:MAG: hypothetical protein JWO47_1081 [Candidatus Saccharibacteria bacterium]|nr:hypothetical protein [Candidatus Saccharibacteria bacterium]
MAKKSSAKKQIWWQIAKRTLIDFFGISFFSQIDVIDSSSNGKKRKTS